MLHGYVFDRVSVLLRDMHFENTRPGSDEGPETGVRLELRLREQQDSRGSEFAAQRVVLDQPVWRADIFVAVGSPADSFDRTHYHSRFEGLEPVKREWSAELTARPFDWLVGELGDLEGLLDRAGVPDDGITEADAAELRRAAPEIAEQARKVFDAVQSGRLVSEVNRPFA